MFCPKGPRVKIPYESRYFSLVLLLLNGWIKWNGDITNLAGGSVASIQFCFVSFEPLEQVNLAMQKKKHIYAIVSTYPSYNVKSLRLILVTLS